MLYAIIILSFTSWSLIATQDCGSVFMCDEMSKGNYDCNTVDMECILCEDADYVDLTLNRGVRKMEGCAKTLVRVMDVNQAAVLCQTGFEGRVAIGRAYLACPAANVDHSPTVPSKTAMPENEDMDSELCMKNFILTICVSCVIMITILIKLCIKLYFLKTKIRFCKIC